MTAVPDCIADAPVPGDPAARAVAGERLAAQVRNFLAGETVSETDGDLLEEVGAVIQGVFHVSAAGEEYDLTAGEGIVIPRGEPRSWRCTEGPGVLYRVHARGDTAL